MDDFKWLPLRLNILPLLHKQSQKLLDSFYRIRQQVRQGDQLGLQTITTISELVQNRLKQMDLFYIYNAKDPRTKYLYAMRAILYQILEGAQSFEKYNVQSFEQGLMQSSMNGDRFKRSPAQSPKSSNSKSKSPKSKNKKGKFGSQSSVSKRLMEIGKPTPNIPTMPTKPNKPVATEQKAGMRLSDLHKETKNKSKTPRKKINYSYLEKPPAGSSRKVEGGQTKRMREQNASIRRIEQQKRQNMQRMKTTEGLINKSMRDLSELVFTIKMTKEEYNQFMKLKRANNHA